MGALLAGYLANAFGRRRTVAALTALTATGFLASAFSQGATWPMVAGRFLQGFAIVCSTVQVEDRSSNKIQFFVKHTVSGINARISQYPIDKQIKELLHAVSQISKSIHVLKRLWYTDTEEL